MVDTNIQEKQIDSIRTVLHGLIKCSAIRVDDDSIGWFPILDNSFARTKDRVEVLAFIAVVLNDMAHHTNLLQKYIDSLSFESESNKNSQNYLQTLTLERFIEILSNVDDQDYISLHKLISNITLCFVDSFSHNSSDLCDKDFNEICEKTKADFKIYKCSKEGFSEIKGSSCCSEIELVEYKMIFDNSDPCNIYGIRILIKDLPIGFFPQIRIPIINGNSIPKKESKKKESKKKESSEEIPYNPANSVHITPLLVNAQHGVNASDGNSPLNVQNIDICQEHPQNQITYVCIPCKNFLCPTCISNSKDTHMIYTSYNSIKEIAQDQYLLENADSINQQADNAIEEYNRDKTNILNTIQQSCSTTLQKIAELTNPNDSLEKIKEEMIRMGINESSIKDLLNITEIENDSMQNDDQMLKLEQECNDLERYKQKIEELTKDNQIEKKIKEIMK